MVIERYKDYLIELYQELNTHHREQTRQNNQLITFYITLISFFLGFHTYLLEKCDRVLINCIFIIVILIGLLINLMLIQLRVWQLRYATALQLLGSMFISDIEISNYKQFYQCIRQFECRSTTKHSLFAPITCKMIWGCIFISLLPFGLYYTYLNIIIEKHKMSLKGIFLGAIFLYLISIYRYFRKKILNTGNKGEINWLLDIINLKVSNIYIEEVEK